MMLIDTDRSTQWIETVSQLHRSSESDIATDTHGFLLQNDFLVLTFDKGRVSQKNCSMFDKY